MGLNSINDYQKVFRDNIRDAQGNKLDLESIVPGLSVHLTWSTDLYAVVMLEAGAQGQAQIYVAKKATISEKLPDFISEFNFPAKKKFGFAGSLVPDYR
ncbi:hypothetical protein J4453_00090 [Candidatus Woesearchaeota archaeon]|nr:hypothetical protein [Candidatus Woesearchaeota archaeon]